MRGFFAAPGRFLAATLRMDKRSPGLSESTNFMNLAISNLMSFSRLPMAIPSSPLTDGIMVQQRAAPPSELREPT